MIKHRYDVSGIDINEVFFTGYCIADDIIKAIQMFRENKCSVWNIERKEQVNNKEEIGIKNIKLLDKNMEKKNIEGIVTCNNSLNNDWSFETEEDSLSSGVCSAIDEIMGRETESGEKFRIIVEKIEQ